MSKALPNQALKRTCAEEAARSFTHLGRAGRIAWVLGGRVGDLR